MKLNRPKRLHGAASLVILLLAFNGAPSAAGEEVEKLVEVGLRKQLLVDDYAVANTLNVSRRLGRAIKQNDGKPIMEPNELEYPLYFGVYFTVFRDQGRFRMWYLATNIPDYDIGYAESEDGINWTRPLVGDGGKSNFVFQGHGFSCFVDPHETDPEHRYKAAYGPAGQFEKSQKAAHLAHSSDGIHWTPYYDGKEVLQRTSLDMKEGHTAVTASDTHNQLIWDDKAKIYRLFTRDLYTSPQSEGAKKISRGSRSMTNPDVKGDPTGWTLVRSWEFDREGDGEYEHRQIYALTDWIYQDVHFAQMSVFTPANGLIDYYIGTSRDGSSWDLSWVYANMPMIPPGPKGSFDAAGAFPSSQVVTWKDRHWLYYGAMDRGHKDPQNRMTIGVATLRLDGFVSLSAGEKPGVMTTNPFKLAGGRLEINVDASQGKLSVEVLDAAGQPIPGFTLHEARGGKGVDDLRFEPAWENYDDLATLTGEVVRLRFHLNRANLYAFKVNP
ncbi:MAG: hypothetical protein WD738_17040 [Pirellulales bacterium]